MLTRTSIATFPSFNRSIFTEEDGTTINNEDKIILNKKNDEQYHQKLKT